MDKDFKAWLNTILAEKKLTVHTAAKMAGISTAHFARVARDPAVAPPRLPLLDSLAPVLSVSFTELFYRAGRFLPKKFSRTEKTLSRAGEASLLKTTYLYQVTFSVFCSSLTSSFLDSFATFGDQEIKEQIDKIKNLIDWYNRNFLAVSLPRFPRTEEGYEKRREFKRKLESEKILMIKNIEDNWLSLMEKIRSALEKADLTPENKMSYFLSLSEITKTDLDEMLFIFDLIPEDFYAPIERTPTPRFSAKINDLSVWLLNVVNSFEDTKIVKLETALTFWEVYSDQVAREDFLSRSKQIAEPEPEVSYDKTESPWFNLKIFPAGENTKITIVVKLSFEHAIDVLPELSDVIRRFIKKAKPPPC